MYKIVLYGNNRKVLDLYDAIKKERNVQVACIVDPGKTPVIRKAAIPLGTIKDNFDGLSDVKAGIFAVLNVNDDPDLKEMLEKAGLGDIKIISGSSASFLYDTGASEEVKKEDYRKIIGELKSMANNLSMLFDKEKLLNEILKGLCDQTKANRASIMLYDKKEKVLKVSMAYGIDRVLWDFIKTPIGEGIAGRVIETKKPALITGSPDDKTFKKLRKREDIKAAICVPLMKDDNVVGVVNLASLENINAFSSKDMEFVKEVSDVAAEILFATKSFSEFKEDSLRYRILSEVSEIISEKRPLYNRLMKVADYLRDKFGVYSALAIKGGDDVVETVATNFPLWEQSDVFWDNTVEKFVYDEKKEVCFLDPESRGFKGYLSKPLVDAGQCFGVMSVLNFGNECDEKTDFFRELAAQLSTLISLSYQKESIAERNRRNDLTEELLSELTLMEDSTAFGGYILKNLARELDAKIGVLRVYDDERKSYIVKDVIGMDNILKKEFFQIDREIVKNVLKSRKNLIVKSVGRDKNFSHLYPAIQSLLVCPMKMGEHMELVFSFYNSEGRVVGKGFSQSDLMFISRLFDKAVLILKDIQEKGLVADEVFLDNLTGLPNFRYFEKRVYDEILRAGRHGKRVVLLVGEFQPYEKYLKTYGKKHTDDIIKKIAFQIRERIRNFEMVARLNVNKFGIMLVDADEKALEVIFRLRKVFEKENWDPKGAIKEGVTIKFGFSRFPDDGEEYDELIVKANHIRG